MNSIIEFNRRTLNSVPNWINISDYNSPPSLFNYGLPKHVYHLINKTISMDVTECDIICFCISLFNNDNIPINYLEIGVSVGKTFYQILEYVNHNSKKYSLNCLDIEIINPILNNLILLKNNKVSEKKQISNVDNKYKFDYNNKFNNTITTWTNGFNEIIYYESNSFDNDIWKIMKKYNIIFSDGHHEPSALMNEYENLKNNNLIDYDKFIYCFDDLEGDKNGGMWQVVLKIVEDLKIITNKEIFLKHYVVNGWLGNHEYKHNFGLISNFEINY